MRVYFSPNGVGLGHIARTVPIMEELESRGAEVIVSTYHDGLDYAKARGLKIIKSVPIDFKVQDDGTVDFKQTAARSGLSLGLRRFLKQVRTEIRNLKSFRPDIVFSDSRASTIVASRLLGIPVILMLNQFRVEIIRRPSSGRLSLMDRLFFLVANIFWVFVRTLIAGVWAQSRMILIPDFPYPNTISLANLTVPRRYQSKVRYVGPIIGGSPKDLPSREEIVKELGLTEGKPRIYAAVSGPKVERKHLVNNLSRIFQQLSSDYEFVMSCGNPNGDIGPKNASNILSYDWIDDETQFKMLKAADIVTSRSGHGTITKALAFGKPLILIPTPDHTEQHGNANRAVQLGVAISIEQKSLNAEKFRESVEKMLGSMSFREKSARLGELILKLDPVKTAADLITTLSKNYQTGAR